MSARLSSRRGEAAAPLPHEPRREGEAQAARHPHEASARRHAGRAWSAPARLASGVAQRRHEGSPRHGVELQHPGRVVAEGAPRPVVDRRWLVAPPPSADDRTPLRRRRRPRGRGSSVRRRRSKRGALMVDAWIADSSLSARFPIYTRANVGEVFPDPVTPLTFDCGIPLAEWGWRDAWVRMGAMDYDEFDPNELRAARHHRRLLLPERLAHPTVRRAGSRPVVADDGRAVLRRPARHPAVRGATRRRAARPHREDRRHVRLGARRDRAARPRGRPAAHQGPAGQPARPGHAHRPGAGRALPRDVRRSLPAPVRAAPVRHATWPPCRSASWRRCARRSASPTRSSTSSPASATSTRRRPPTRCGTSAASWLGSPELRPPSTRGSTGCSTGGRRSAHRRPASCSAVLAEFQREFGSRGPNEWEVRSPTWETRPELALAAIDRMRLRPRERVASRPERGQGRGAPSHGEGDRRRAGRRPGRAGPVPRRRPRRDGVAARP